MDRARILETRTELRSHLIAQEDWHPNYRTNPKAFRSLTRSEAAIETGMREYLYGLRTRASKLIDWNEVYRRLSAKDVTVTISDDAWQNETDLLFQVLLDPITQATVAGSLIAQANLGIDVGFGVGNATVLKAARQYTGKLIKGLNDTTKSQISQAIEHGLAQNETIQQIIERVATFVDSSYRAEIIARTEAVRAATQGQLLLADQINAQFKVWEDGQPGECHICQSVKPKRIPVDELFSIGEDGPPAHPRCILPGQEVIASNVFATFTSDYSGEIYRIETVSGTRLAVTPNHPVLTRSGWVTASELHKGDYLVNTSGDIEWMGSDFIGPDVQTVKTTIEEVTIPGTVILRSVPATTVDFHGDGTACKNIDIVYSERALLDTPDTKAFDFRRNAILQRTDIAPVSKDTPRSVDLLDDRYLPTPDRIVSRLSPSPALSGSPGGLVQPVSLSNPTDRYAELLQTVGDDRAVNTKFMREFLDAAPTSVFLDEIVSVEWDTYHGKVYDLSALNQVYTCNGIVVHNCRCGMSLDFATPDEAQSLADGTYQPDESDSSD